MIRREILALTGMMTVLGFAIGIGAPGLQGNSDAVNEQSQLAWQNDIQVERNGEVIAEFENTLTDQGKNWIRSQIAGVSSGDDLTADSVNASYISLGSGKDVASGDTVLDSEISTGGLSRTEGSVTVFGAGEFQVQNNFAATSNVGVVNTTGLNWDGSGNSLISGGSFGTEANIQDGDTLTVTHNITIS